MLRSNMPNFNFKNVLSHILEIGTSLNAISYLTLILLKPAHQAISNQRWQSINRCARDTVQSDILAIIMARDYRVLKNEIWFVIQTVIISNKLWINFDLRYTVLKSVKCFYILVGFFFNHTDDTEKLWRYILFHPKPCVSNFHFKRQIFGLPVLVLTPWPDVGWNTNTVPNRWHRVYGKLAETRNQLFKTCLGVNTWSDFIHFFNFVLSENKLQISFLKMN